MSAPIRVRLMEFCCIISCFLYKNAILALIMSDHSTDDPVEREKYPVYSAKDLNVLPFGFLGITVHFHCIQHTVLKG